MPTTREVEAKRVERIRKQDSAAARRELMRVGPDCPRCGKRTQARLVEATGDRVHPGGYTIEDDPPIVDLPAL